MLNQKLRFLSIVISLLYGNMLYSQGWDKSNICSSCSGVWDLISTPDGGIVSPSYTPFKLDSAGNLEWKIEYLGGKSGIYTSQNTYMIVSHSYFNKARVIKLDASGNVIWDRKYGSDQTSNYTNRIMEESPGSYLVTGKFADGVTMMRINENGDSLWSNQPRLFNTDASYADITSDNNYIVISSIGTSTQRVAQKIDRITGDTLWTKSLFFNVNEAQRINGGYIANGGMFTKYDSDFNLIWVVGSALLPNGDYYYPHSATVLPSGNFMSVGETIDQNGFKDIFMVKYSSNGMKLWSKQIFKKKTGSQPLKIITTLQGGLAITFNDSGARIVYTDTLGNVKANYIKGKVHFDESANCLKDAGELAAYGAMVKLEPGSEYASIDTSGNFIFQTDTGSYTLSVMPPNNLWSSTCSPTAINLDFTSYNITSDNNNFLLTPAANCAKLSVDIAAPLLRRCFRTNLRVQYHNEGVTVNNVKVKVLLPEGIIPLSASKSYTVSEDTLIFDIGTLKAGENGYLTIEDSISCDLELGATQCLSAWISPANYCGEVINTSWDKSSIVLTGKCQGDTLVRFVILNHGEDMQGPSEYRVFVDNIMATSGTFQLMSGETLVLDYAAMGTNLRVEADQRPFHPGKSRPRATVSDCGERSFEPEGSSEIFVHQDDDDVFVERECAEVRGAFDPNEKSVSPKGITENNYIKAEDELQYRIDFQNTGTDTAFTVRIQDTLSTHLDLNTFKSGVSSHGYTYKIYDTNPPVIEWTFANILLADSNVNEPMSHGFVKFRIAQKPNNPKGTVIMNKAAIIFDYNVPVITNTSRVIVHDTVIFNPSVLSSKTYTSLYGGKISVAPNPFSGKTTVKIDVPVKSEYRITIYDLTGKELRTVSTYSSEVEIDKGDLSKGMYIFSVYSEGNLISTGKLMVE